MRTTAGPQRLLTMTMLGAALLTAWPTKAHAVYRPQERIPTNSPVYRDLERLATTYGQMPRFFATRPLRLQEALGFLESLTIEAPESAYDPAMIRVRRAIDATAPGATGTFMTIRGDSDEAVTVSPYVSVSYAEDPRNHPEINRDYRVGAQTVASLDSATVFVFDGYIGTASQGGRGTPNFGTLNSWIEGVDFNSWMDEAYAEFKVSKIRFLAGHTWLRWGPGRDGTLALSDATPALDLVRGETGFRSGWRFQWFVSVLDPGPQTYLAGHRMEWSFGQGVSLGINELARFDGTSQALLYFVPVVPYSFWEKRPKSTPDGAVPGDTTGLAFSKNNVLWSADVQLHMRRGFRMWGEFMVDDISFSRDYKPDMIGWQVGAEERWRMGQTGTAEGTRYRMLTASVEYTRVNNFTYSAWHGHDFASQGFPIGFVTGPDVMNVSAELDYEFSSALEFRLRGEYRRKGEGALGDPWIPAQGKVDAGRLEGITERDARVSASVLYTPRRMLRLEATVGTASLRNRDHLNVGTDTEVPFRLAARISY